MFSSNLLNTVTFLPQAAKEQTQDLIVKTNKLQGEKWVDSKAWAVSIPLYLITPHAFKPYNLMLKPNQPS